MARKKKEIKEEEKQLTADIKKHVCECDECDSKFLRSSDGAYIVTQFECPRCHHISEVIDTIQ